VKTTYRDYEVRAGYSNFIMHELCESSELSHNAVPLTGFDLRVNAWSR
jgi:hypothetical protein